MNPIPADSPADSDERTAHLIPLASHSRNRCPGPAGRWDPDLESPTRPAMLRRRRGQTLLRPSALPSHCLPVRPSNPQCPHSYRPGRTC
jgi:hypothetical protein